MVGLCFLKDKKGLSDEELCANWCENTYFQHFCVETFFQHRFPTDVPLCHKARDELVTLARDENVKLRQSYVCKSKNAVFMANRYTAARQMKRAQKKIKEVRNYLGRVVCNIEAAII